MKSFAYLALAGLLASSTTSAFTPQSLAGTTSNTAARFGRPTGSELGMAQTIPEMTRAGTGWDSFCEVPEGTTIIPGGEAQRPFRRTVYTHDDWKKHRSQDRFIYYLQAILGSGVYDNLAREVLAVTAIATALVFYNGCAGGFTDLLGGKSPAVLPDLPKLTLPLAAFTITSPSLGLLLGKYFHLCARILWIWIFVIFAARCAGRIFNNLYLSPHLCFTFPVPCIKTSLSLPNQHQLSALGRGTEELGHEH